MTRTLKFAPVMLFQVQTQVTDDGPVPSEGPNINGSIALADLIGVPLYDQLVAKLAEMQSEMDATEPADEPAEASP